MASRPGPRVSSVALRRLEGHNKSPDSHQAVPGRRRKMARSQLEETETAQAPGRKSRRRIEQGRSGVDKKADRNQPADTDQDLQSTVASNCKKGIQMSNMTIPGQGTTILRNHSKY